MLIISFVIIFFLLFYAGSTIEKKWLRWVYNLSATSIIAGELFLILHWFYFFDIPAGKVLMIGGAVVCALIYGYHFINISHKKLHHYLLIAWLSLFAIDIPYHGYHMPYSSYLQTLVGILLWANIIYVFYFNFREE